MLRVARGYVPSHEIAEEVVQEAWIALLKGISKFEGRSSLRTWLFTVMINIAKTRGIRERRSADAEIAAFTGGTVDSSRFRPSDAADWPGHWKDEAAPAPFPDTPEGSVLGSELIAVARRELDKLPERQRMVVTLRDMLGFDSSKVCELLEISVANQRVLLHRGRAPGAGRLLGGCIMNVGPMDCNELVELVTAYLDGSLDPEMRARFDVHLLECDGCENYLQQFRATIETLGSVRDDELDPSYREKLLKAFRDWR
jgi:RNA polymerase sigma-70 factor (ECF subfamily)